MSDDYKPVPVFTTNDQGLLAIVQSMLDGAEIPFFIRGAEAASLMPVKATVVVPAEHEESARELIGELQKAQPEQSED